MAAPPTPRPQRLPQRRPAHHGAGPARTGTDHHRHRHRRLQDRRGSADLGLQTSVHIESGVEQGSKSRPIATLREHGLLHDTTTVLHLNGISDDQLRMLADAGSSVSVSPDIELKMGFGIPMTGRTRAAGLQPALSIDDVPSAGGDMFSTMRTAYATQ
ncbi:hypothetical protein [Streptomyces sp. Tu102]|uniref:hypothetical protein n=1 Tax=Streptomyces TaxID=1883 RepID=UPI002029DA6D|nr:hypothetical protein [Streptomyces sp. Tu102]